MSARNPTDRPPLDAQALVRVLKAHDIDWVLAGSYVLTLYEAPLTPNDLDVVPDVHPSNLARLADCLTALSACPAYFENWTHPRNTLEACLSWQPAPPTASCLDWLYVTEHGMLDIVIANAAPYSELMSDATQFTIGGVSCNVCHPTHVLRALEHRNRRKDTERHAIYATLRRRFGLPENP